MSKDDKLQDVTTPLRYPGGKCRSAKLIADLFPKKGVREYREPFVGGGSVYIEARKLNRFKRFWINDKFTELIHFWQTVQHPDAAALLQFELRLLKSEFAGDVERIKDYFLSIREEPYVNSFRDAFTFFVINRVSFSGTTLAGGFSKHSSISRFTDSSIDRLKSMPELLAETEITNLEYTHLIDAPGKGVFLFLDPPYLGSRNLYGRRGQLHSFDHDGMAERLRTTKHKFLLTYDDCPETRKLYSWANITPWEKRYGMDNCNAARTTRLGKELFISNY